MNYEMRGIEFKRRNWDALYCIERKIANGFLRYSRQRNKWDKFTNSFFKLVRKKYPEFIQDKKDLGIFYLRFGNSPDLLYGNFGKDACCSNENNYHESLGLEIFFSVLFIDGTYEVSFPSTKFRGDFIVKPGVKFEYFDVSNSTFENSFRCGIIAYPDTNSVSISKANFLGAEFLGNTSLTKVIFVSGVFRGQETENISFENSSFKEFFLLQHVEFKKNVTFKASSFKKLIFLGVSFEESADFTDASFEENFFDTSSKFKKGVIFEYSKFQNSASFNKTSFEHESNFFKASFEGKFNLEGIELGQKSILNLNKAVFKGESAFLTKSDNEPENYLGLKELKAHHTIFECPVVFDLKFQSCPDFSKTHFLKYYSIKETWLKEGETIPYSEITKDDVEKFRFFKNHFKEKGNHFKEAEYFSYEMIAVKKRKRAELNQIKTSETEKCQSLFALLVFPDVWFSGKILGALKSLYRRTKNNLFSRKRWRQRFTLKYCDLLLFRAYNFFSRCGISISRPLIGIAVSLVIFSLLFANFFSQEFVLKTKQDTAAINNTKTNYYITQNTVLLSEAKDLGSLDSEVNHKRFFANAQNDNAGKVQDDSVTQNEETGSQSQQSEAPFSVIAGKTFLLTINPFGSFKMVENSSSFWFMFWIGIQAILNTTLLFLLALGIRNRFKLK